MTATHAQLVLALVLSLLVAGIVARRPDWRLPALAVLGLGFTTVVVGVWTPLIVALVAAAHLATARPEARTRAAVVLLVAVLLAFKARALATGGLLGDSLFVPVGLSYLVFQLVAYVVDVHRGRVDRASGLAELGAYCFLPPIRMSGPVLRFREFRRSARRATPLDTRRLLAGLALIGVGIVKKRVLGDAVLDQLDTWPVGDVDRLAKAVAQLCALYFDASGFADFAEGCGVLVGIKIPASFSRPLTRGRSLADFWRRWQMTVMAWFRDYVYAPVRGARGGAGRARLALAASFVASAAWHGLHPAWFAWGAITVAALLIENRTAQAARRSPVADGAVRVGRRVVMYAYMFLLTTLLLAADRQTLDSVRETFSGPFTVDGAGGRVALALGMVGALLVLDAWRSRRKEVGSPVNAVLTLAGLVVLAWPGSVDPFVYQRF